VLEDLVRRRARGEPLQYIIGNQPFGDLEILCRPGVLIPRAETETYTQRIASLISNLPRSLHNLTDRLGILDLCTGTGCIPLLLHSLLAGSATCAAPAKSNLSITAVDISPLALRLAEDNLIHNLRLGVLSSSARKDIEFVRSDVLNGSRNLLRSLHTGTLKDNGYDVVISNPPYISPKDYAPGGRTTPSVRKFEPKLALVPPARGTGLKVEADLFYTHIVDIVVAARAKLICMEVGDSGQAARVADMAASYFESDCIGSDPAVIEIWNDDGTVVSHSQAAKQSDGAGMGLERVVVIFRHEWALWRNQQSPLS
jgi:HemK-like putative methylase